MTSSVWTTDSSAKAVTGLHAKRRFLSLLIIFVTVLAVGALLSCGTVDSAMLVVPGTDSCPWQIANISFAVTQHTVNQILSATTPLVESAIRNVTVPPQTVEHADVAAMELTNFTLRHLNMQFAVPVAPFATVEAVGMGVEIGETNFTAHVLFSTCTGVFWANMTNMTLLLPLRLRHHDNGTLYSDVQQAVFVNGNFTIDHRLDTAFCRAAQSVAEVFMGEINAMVERKTIEALQVQLPEAVEAELNERLRSLPLYFYTDPLVEGDKMMATADLIRGRATRDPPISTAAVLPARGVALEVPEYTINNVIADLRCRHKLNFLIPTNFTTEDVKDVWPELATLCPHCTLDVIVYGNKGATRVRFDASSLAGSVASGSAELTVDALEFGVVLRASSTAVKHQIEASLSRTWSLSESDKSRLEQFSTYRLQDDSNSTDVPLLLLETNMTVSASDIRIAGARADAVNVHVNALERFDLSVVASNVGPISAQFIVDMKNLVSQFAVPLLNAGSPYPMGPLFEHATLDLAGHSFVAATDLTTIVNGSHPLLLQ